MRGSVHGSGSERLFRLLASGREQLHVACRSLKLEIHATT